MTWTTRPRSEIAGLAAVVVGAGPNVLLLHGVGLCADAWGAQFDALPARMVAPDMPGHGQSHPPPKSLHMDAYVDHALSVLRTLSGPTLVVGHSMGAMLALELAARVPEGIAGVVALNAVFERSPAAARAVQARAATLDGRTAADPTPTLNRWFGAAPSDARDACARWLTSVDPSAYQSAYSAFAHSRIPGRDRLGGLKCPALFMTGAAEPNSTPQMAQQMATLAPEGRVTIVEGAAHMMPMTHAAPVNAALTEMLKEVLQ